MSDPSYGPVNRQNMVPTNGISYPGIAVLQGYNAFASAIMSKLSGQDDAITTLVLDVVLMVFITPTVFLATMIAGMAGTGGNAARGGTTANGSVVTATADDIFMVRADMYKDPSCSLIGADDKSYELEPYVGSEDVYLVENLPVGLYVLQCDGITNGVNITVFNASPEVVTEVFVMFSVWGIAVDVVNLTLLTVGIVLPVKVNGRCRRITQESMLSAVH